MRINKQMTNTQPISDVKGSEEPKFQYSEAIDHIKSAIDVLGKNAKDDQLAKDEIANLSVVLMELQSADI